jgi:GTP 3',8-cyclase
MPMKDRFNREIRSLRISITQRCNLKCFYCHKEGEVTPGTEMTPEEIGRLVSIASGLGMSKLKITGGEPLVRKDVTRVIEACGGSMEEISLTTNGVLLSEKAQELKEVGLDRVNVSLDSLDKETYRKISGMDTLDRVIEGIRAANQAGLVPVKINMVMMNGLNDHEFERMIEFAGEENAILQLIELETSKEHLNDGLYSRYHYDLKEIEEQLKGRAERIVSRRMHHRMKYYLPTEVEIVRPMHNSEFCANCTRIRITSDGYLKPCLLTNKGNVDVLRPMRAGVSDQEIVELFMEAVNNREPYWVKAPPQRIS